MNVHYFPNAPRIFEYKFKYGENVEITLSKGEANLGQPLFQIVQNFTPKYSVTNDLVQVTYKILLSLNDRSSKTF